MSYEFSTVEIVSARLAKFVSLTYKWPELPSGCTLEFIVYPDGKIYMDFYHPASCKFWSEDNYFLALPIKHDGTEITFENLNEVGIPFLNGFWPCKSQGQSD